MGESQCELTVLDVAELLQAQYAFISGGKSHGGHPIITFPDNLGQTEISPSDYRNLISYLVSVPSLHEADEGFALIIDRRKDKWNSIKSVLLNISGYFPGNIHVVFVLKPSGFFQRHFQEISSKSLQDHFKFEIIICEDVVDLNSFIDKTDLSKDLGGYIAYDHSEWIQHRAAVEKFSANTSSINSLLKTLVETMQETEMPNDVLSTQNLIEDHQTEKNQAKEDLSSAVAHGETLLSCVRVPNGTEESKCLDSVLSASKLVHVTAIERLLVQLEETERAFDTFWESHYVKLQQCLQLRKFEDDFKQLHLAVEIHMETVLKYKDNFGDSSLVVTSLMSDLNDSNLEAQDDLKKSCDLVEMGVALIENQHYAVDSIKPKCDELSRMCEDFTKFVQNHQDALQRSKELHSRIDRANKWCAEGVDYLASSPLERLQTAGGLEAVIVDIEQFLSKAQQVNLSNPKEFKNMFDNIMSLQVKLSVQKVLKRIEDVTDMCQSRISSLKKMASKSSKQEQPVSPETVVMVTKEQSSMATVDHHPVKTKRPSNRTKRGNRHLSKSKIQVMRSSGTEANDSSSSYDGDTEVLSPSPITTSSSSSSIMSPTSSSAQPPVPAPATNPTPSDRRVSLTEGDVLLLKRGHVMRELIETERLYVTEIEAILHGYAEMMEEPSLQYLIPEHLQGKKHMVFGNLEDIFLFHKNMFVKELEQCDTTPSLVGRCFVQRREELQMYSEYCQNKPRSEALRNESGNNNPFFKECQKRLGHKLPLGAYLIKPVQRITKYQLLLREMLKYTDDREASDELRQALQCVLAVVKYVNDTMHQISIKGFQGNLSEQGKLLTQGAFNVWTEHKDKKDKIKDLRFKPMQRHIFLYEKLLMFCKKKDGKNERYHQDKASYIYKSSLKMANIGLTENIKNDKRKFEVWLHGRLEVLIIQAPTVDIKNDWVKEIKRVLLGQFDQIKGIGPIPVPVAKRSSLEIKQAESTTPTTEINGINNNMITDNKKRLDLIEPVVECETDDGWSSDEFSQTDDELIEGSDLHIYTVAANYQGEDAGEITITEGDKVEVVTHGNSGWWYVRSLSTQEEGWAPASYLEQSSRQSSRSTISLCSQESGVESSHNQPQMSAVCPTTSNTNNLLPRYGITYILEESMV